VRQSQTARRAVAIIAVAVLAWFAAGCETEEERRVRETSEDVQTRTSRAVDASGPCSEEAVEAGAQGILDLIESVERIDDRESFVDDARAIFDNICESGLTEGNLEQYCEDFSDLVGRAVDDEDAADEVREGCLSAASDLNE
jgi:hypothetical protein